jgi:hypothetical protein
MVDRRTYMLFAFSVLAMLIVLFIPASAQQDTEDIELLITPSDIRINTTETKFVELTITNNRDIKDSFSISVWPSTTWSGITPNLEKDKLINMEPGANATTRLYFSVDSSADEIITTFLVTARSITEADLTISGAVNVRVIRKTAIYVSDLKLDKYVLGQADCITITTTITNFGSESGPYRLQTDVKSGSTLLERFDDFIETIESKSINDAENRYCFDRYAIAGTYTIETTLKTGLNKFVDARTMSLKINEEMNLIKTEKVSYNPFAKTKTITIKNEGNVIEEDFYITETVSEFISKFFYPEETPVISESMDRKVSYKWFVGSLAPGAEVQVKYEIRFFSIWFSGLMIVVVVFLAFSYVYRPKISKKANLVGSLKRGKEIPMMLDVKNSTIHEIKNITVHDTVPAIAKLVERFDTMKPDVKKSEAGAELTWKIKSLQPLEERVLTYKITPVVEVIGSLKMPSATMSFIDRKKVKKTIASRAVEIK